MTVERFLTGKPETLRKLNLLVDAVTSLENLTGDVFIRTANTPVGTTIRLNFAAVLERIMKSKRPFGHGHIAMRFTGSEPLPSSTPTLIPINSIVSDPGGWYDPINFGFIVPSDGMYFTSSAYNISYGAQADVPAAVSVRINGSIEMISTREYTPSLLYGGASAYWCTYGMMLLDKDDLIQFTFYHLGTPMLVLSGGHAGMWRIGEL